MAALDGQVAREGEGLAGIAGNLAVLAGYAVALGLLARWRQLRALTA